MIYFTADHHFGHTNIIKYCNRPFKDVEEMNKILINNWNDTISDNDTVYHLGDFALMNNNKITEYLNKLRGIKILILGNHDRLNRKNKNLFKNIYKSYSLFYRGLTIVLSHYPYKFIPPNGVIHLHGHSHGKETKIKNKIDVGVDNTNYYPISIDEVIEKYEF